MEINLKIHPALKYNMRFSIVLFSTCLFIACNSHKPEFQSNDKLTLLDSLPITEKPIIRAANDFYALYPVYYMGAKQDTIYLGKEISRYEDHRIKIDRNETRWLRDITKVKLTVDTSFKLGHLVNYMHYDTTKSQMITDSIRTYPAYTILLENHSDSLLYVGIYNELNTIMQVKTENGQWIDLEEPISHGCIFAARTMILQPRNILIAKVIRYKGDFLALCRLKFLYYNQSLYSNSFKYSINRSQLQIKD
jgi:hypothetical protein